MCAHGCVPSGKAARNLSQSMWTRQVCGFARHVQSLFITPLPFGRFLRRSSRIHTVFWSSQMMACLPSAFGESGAHLHKGSAWRKQGDTMTDAE
jgi:hypothetical protein